MSTDDREQRLKSDVTGVMKLAELSKGALGVQVDQTVQHYLLTLRCRGLRLRFGVVKEIDEHQVTVHLGPDYPVKPPTLLWTTPVFHPNVLGSGVCLLGHWGKVTPLWEVCIWLWDMARYRLYNIDDHLDHAAALWAKEHEKRFPLDQQDLRALMTAAQPREPSHDDIVRSIQLMASGGRTP